MKKIMAMFLIVLAVGVVRGHSQVPGPLKLVQTITLPGLKDGDFDHFQVDPAGMRLFLAAEDNSAIEVIDLRTNKLIQKLTGTKAPIEFRPLPEDDPKIRRPDITKAKTLLGWQPQVPLEVGLKRTIDYFRGVLL